jgi:hypothetical protein
MTRCLKTKCHVGNESNNKEVRWARSDINEQAREKANEWVEGETIDQAGGEAKEQVIDNDENEDK